MICAPLLGGAGLPTDDQPKPVDVRIRPCRRWTTGAPSPDDKPRYRSIVSSHLAQRPATLCRASLNHGERSCDRNLLRIFGIRAGQYGHAVSKSLTAWRFRAKPPMFRHFPVSATKRRDRGVSKSFTNSAIVSAANKQ